MKTAIVATLAAAATAQPNFPPQWSSFTETVLVQNAGTYSLPNGDYCCASNAVNCQVQVQVSAGMTYFDFTNNVTATVYGPMSSAYAIVSLYNNAMEVAVDSTYTCQAFCPIEGGMAAFNLQGYTDQGAVMMKGKQLEAWVSVDKFPIFNITMDTDTMYIDQSNMNAPVPVLDTEILTPFGQYVGFSNTTYANWKYGQPDPKWFAVKGLQNCPMSQNCNSDSRQGARLSTRQLGVWAKHHVAAKNEAALQAAQMRPVQQVSEEMIQRARSNFKNMRAAM